MIEWPWLIVAAALSSGATVLGAGALLHRRRCAEVAAGGFYHRGAYYVIERDRDVDGPLSKPLPGLGAVQSGTVESWRENIL